MKPPENMVEIIGGKRYSTKTATLLAGDDYWDGNNYERKGTNTFLYRTPKGTYFTVNLTQWQEDHDTLTPVSVEEAASLYESTLTDRRVPYEEAFPDLVVEDA